MRTNAYECLVSFLPNLMPKLDSNFSVSSALQALFTYVAHLAADERLDVKGMRATLSVVDDKRREDNYLQAKLQVDFSTQSDSSQPVKVDKKILWQRNLVIAQVLEVNPNVRDLARDLVCSLESLGARYKVPWEDIRCGSRQILVRRGGRRLEMDLGQKEWLPDEELDQVEAG